MPQTNTGLKTSTTNTDCPDCPTDSDGGVGVSLGFENTIDDHCPDLKNLLDPTKSNVKPSLENLKTTVDQDGENGVSFKKEGATYSNTNLTPTATTTIGIPTGRNNYAGAHSHPSLTTFPMFSWSDIYTLFNLHNRANIDVKNEVTLFLVSKKHFLNTQVNIYALRIDDFTAFRNKVNQMLNDIVKENPKLDITATIDERLEALNKKLGKKYKATGDDRQEKAFLDFFKEFNISLFKANDAIDNWSELDATAFTFNTSGITETPCN